MSLPFMSCYVTNLSHFLLELFNSLDSDIIFPSVLSFTESLKFPTLTRPQKAELEPSAD